MPPRRFVLSLVLASATVLAPALPGATAWAAPSYTTEERAFAIAGPSLVYIESRASGFLRRKDSGEAVHPKAIVATTRCSGFGITDQGHVVTVTHCLQPSASQLRTLAAGVLATDLVESGQLTADKKDAYVKDLQSTTDFTGDTAGSAPSQKVYGQFFQATSSLTGDPALSAQVVKTVPVADGDVSLLKFSRYVPVAELSPDQPSVGAQVYLAGFFSAGNKAYTTQSKSAKVASRVGTAEPATFELDSEIGSASNGGMVLDSSGRVVGMINEKSTGDPSKRITSTQHIRNLLDGAKLSNTKSFIDDAYQHGLNDYFGGRYSAAITNFDDVTKTVPDHAQAVLYRKQAAERLAIEGDSKAAGMPTWMIVALAALGFGLAASLAFIVVLLVRRRRQPAVPDYLMYAPVSGMPVSGMPISAMPVSGLPTSGVPTSGAGYGQYVDYLSALRDEQHVTSDPAGPQPEPGTTGDAGPSVWGPPPKP